MRRAVWTGGREFRVEEKLVPEPGPGQVRVQVEACGVCLTDVHRVDGYFGPAEPPLVLGHEYSGRVEATGPEVDGIAIGTRAACASTGGFAELAIVPANRLYPIPEHVSPEAAAFVEPIACCVAAVRNGRLPLGCSALVTGAGPMGLILLQLLLRGGAARVLVSEPNPERRALATRLGASRAVDPRETSLAEAVRSFTGGVGVDVAFDAAGQPALVQDCLSAVTDGGTVVLVGVPPAAARLDFAIYPFHRRNLTLTGSYGAMTADSFRAAVTWLDQLDLAALVSHRFGLGQMAEAFDVARTGAGLKAIVYPQIRGGETT